MPSALSIVAAVLDYLRDVDPEAALRVRELITSAAILEFF